MVVCLFSPFGVLISIFGFIHIASSQSCTEWNDPVECVTDSGGACKYVNGLCRCVAEVQLDILFGVDTSGSIGLSGFQIQKQFIENLVVQGINNGSRIGFTMFNTYINESRDIQEWDTDELTLYTRGLYWTSGWTNTPGLLDSALTTFTNSYDADRQQILMLITDGSPCLPSSQGGCPQGVCQYANQIKTANIRTVIVAVGGAVDEDYIGCLTQSEDDFVPVGEFSTEAFESIMGSLSGIFCPISKEFKITEVKAEKKPTGWNSRLTRFVEVYNTGIDFNLNDIGISGLISMTRTAGPDVTVSQGQYVVFYDASDEPLGATSDVLSTPSCHLCEDPCDLTGCLSTDETYTGYCWCENSIYVACGNSGDGTSNCDANIAVTGGEDACGECTFNDAMDRSSWDVTFSDSAADIDSVVYDSSTWIETDDGYSYELISKGFDNDLGDNWSQSCSPFGTPGSDPVSSCSTTCNTNGIDCGFGGYCDTDTGLCVCDESTGYYPDCTDPTTCLKCKSTPTVPECSVVWRKNGTDRYASFNWSETATDKDGGYILYWFDGSISCQNGVIGGSAATGCDVITNDPTYVYALAQRIDNYYPYNDTIGGYVTSYSKVCNGSGSCDEYESAMIACHVSTQSPTFSPTATPTRDPTTVEPTVSRDPTMDPTTDPSTNPTVDPTSDPTTNSPTANPTTASPTRDFDEAQQIKVDIDTDSTLFIGIVIVSAGAFVIGVGCILYLLCLSGLLKRAQQPGTASVKQTIQALGILGLIGVGMEIFDIVTDYLYAVDLITSKNDDIRQLGWVSLFSAILGLSLFGIKMLVTRKLIGYQETKLRQKLTSKLSTKETIDIVTKIRKRRIDVDILCLLIACVEDVPQALIVVIVINSNTDWNAISILNFSLACISFVWKLIQVASAKLGCKDPEVGIEDTETKMVTQMELGQVNENKESKLDGDNTDNGNEGKSAEGVKHKEGNNQETGEGDAYY